MIMSNEFSHEIFHRIFSVANVCFTFSTKIHIHAQNMKISHDGASLANETIRRGRGSQRQKRARRERRKSNWENKKSINTDASTHSVRQTTACWLTEIAEWPRQADLIWGEPSEQTLWKGTYFENEHLFSRKDICHMNELDTYWRYRLKAVTAQKSLSFSFLFSRAWAT